MKNRRSGSRLREQITQEAARLMYEEQVAEYYTAKRMAAKRVLGRTAGAKQRFRPEGMPSNGEIQAALLRLATLAEGQDRSRRLAAMRLVALELTKPLEMFAPRLIGSVSTGHVRRGSDIDIQVFVDDSEYLTERLDELAWSYDQRRVTISKFGEIREYLHVYVDDVFPVELSVYPRGQLRFLPRSSTDGKPIRRLSSRDLHTLIEREHPVELQRYQAEGLAPLLAELETETESLPGPFDGLLSNT